MKKYVLASNDDNRNIAVIGVEDSKTMAIDGVFDEDFKKRLIKALEEEFGTPVSIKSIEGHTYSPISLSVTILIGLDYADDQYTDVIELEETWVY